MKYYLRAFSSTGIFIDKELEKFLKNNIFYSSLVSRPRKSLANVYFEIYSEKDLDFILLVFDFVKITEDTFVPL